MNVDIYKKIKDQVDVISVQIPNKHRLGDKVKVGGQIVHEPISVSLSMLLGESSANGVDKIVMMYTINDGVSCIIAVDVDEEWNMLKPNDIVIINGVYVSPKLKDNERQHNLAVIDDINLPIILISSIEVLDSNDA